jgi:hypothetical protein
MKSTNIYKVINNCEIKADVHYINPEAPVLIYIHSGGLIWGTRTDLSEEQIHLLGVPSELYLLDGMDHVFDADIE